MPTQTVQPATFLLKSFALWYYKTLSQRIAHFGHDLLITVTCVVPFGFLLKSFFSPWKQIHDTAARKPGLQLQAMTESFVLSITARAVGACIRIVTILFGIILLCIAVSVIVILFAAWALLPVVLSGLLLLAVIII